MVDPWLSDWLDLCLYCRRFDGSTLAADPQCFTKLPALNSLPGKELPLFGAGVLFFLMAGLGWVSSRCR